MLRNLFVNDPTWALWGELDRQMDWMLGGRPRPDFRTEPLGPQAYVQEDKDGVRIVVEVPGLRADEIEIAATRDTLSVKGQRKVQAPEGAKVLRRERRDLRFDATYRFEADIDPDKVTAKVDNGLLTVTAPLAEKIGPKRITVQAS